MSKFEIESHEFTPQDQYVKEIVTIKFTLGEDAFYVPYFRKSTKEGKLFWGVASAGYTHEGTKKFIEAFQLDSRHLEKKIKEYLDGRKWEGVQRPAQQQAYYPHGLAQQSPMANIPEMPPMSMDEVAGQEQQLPF